MNKKKTKKKKKTLDAAITDGGGGAGAPGTAKGGGGGKEKKRLLPADAAGAGTELAAAGGMSNESEYRVSVKGGKESKSSNGDEGAAVALAGGGFDFAVLEAAAGFVSEGSHCCKRARTLAAYWAKIWSLRAQSFSSISSV